MITISYINFIHTYIHGAPNSTGIRHCSNIYILGSWVIKTSPFSQLAYGTSPLGQLASVLDKNPSLRSRESSYMILCSMATNLLPRTCKLVCFLISFMPKHTHAHTHTQQYCQLILVHDRKYVVGHQARERERVTYYTAKLDTQSKRDKMTDLVTQSLWGSKPHVQARPHKEAGLHNHLTLSLALQ